MVDVRWCGGALLLVSACLLVAGCAAPEPASSAISPDDAASQAPAAAPEGSTARQVAYRCASGRSATLVVALPDPADLAAVLDRIDPCEYDGGLRSATISPDRRWHSG